MRFKDLVFIPDSTGEVEKQALLKIPGLGTLSVIQGGVARTQSSNQYEILILDDTGFIYKRGYMYPKDIEKKIEELKQRSIK